MNDAELEAIYNDAIDGEDKTVLDGLRAVAKAEREACAKVCEEMFVGAHDGVDDLAEELVHMDCAAKIRERSN